MVYLKERCPEAEISDPQTTEFLRDREIIDRYYGEVFEIRIQRSVNYSGCEFLREPNWCDVVLFFKIFELLLLHSELNNQRICSRFVETGSGRFVSNKIQTSQISRTFGVRNFRKVLFFGIHTEKCSSATNIGTNLAETHRNLARALSNSHKLVSLRQDLLKFRRNNFFPKNAFFKFFWQHFRKCVFERSSFKKGIFRN